MMWFFLILVAQLTWAIGSHIDGYLMDRYGTEEDDATGKLVLVSAFFGLCVAVVILVVSHFLHVPLLTDGFSISLALSIGVLEILWLIPYFYALDRTNETSTTTLMQIVPIFGLLFGYFVFKEQITSVHVAIALVIILGAIVVSLSDEEKGWRIDGKAIFLMLISTAIISFSAFLFKFVALEISFWTTAFWLAIGQCGTGVIIFAVVRKYREEFKRFLRAGDWWGYSVNAINEVSDNVAILLFYAAVTIAPSTALAQSSTAFQPIFVLLISIGLAYFGSRRHQTTTREWCTRIAGVLLITVGSYYLLTLPLAQ